ncbi:hypothetical protein CDD81_3298 [Ophiocordyceps australis]|uniref:Uncharacterized protein n=1 Tax=Ophiocordyceps australis TaxID=1399860 RepID=A0A2C5Y8X6_9HYPO|nr:hypothetical protein CDD81_3298 [Ophiocordyceps australis]
MPSKTTGVWDSVPFLTELTLLLYEAAHRSGGLTPAIKDAIAWELERAGHAVTWEAIRLAFSRPQIAMSGARQVMKWGPDVHEDILIAVFKHVSFGSDTVAAIMQDLRAKGYAFSESALRYYRTLCIPNTALSFS